MEEDEEGNVIPVDSVPIDVLQVDMLDGVISGTIAPAEVAGLEIETFDTDFPSALPATAHLLQSASDLALRQSRYWLACLQQV